MMPLSDLFLSCQVVKDYQLHSAIDFSHWMVCPVAENIPAFIAAIVPVDLLPRSEFRKIGLQRSADETLEPRIDGRKFRLRL
jgi:hypothetical protein